MSETGKYVYFVPAKKLVVDQMGEIIQLFLYMPFSILIVATLFNNREINVKNLALNMSW